MHSTALQRGGRWLGVTATAVALVAAATTSAQADPQRGTGTADDPWVPAKTARIDCDTATRFGNYLPGSYDLKTPMETLTRGQQIVIRYETSDRYAVMAKYSDANTKWAFILRSCVQFY